MKKLPYQLPNQFRNGRNLPSEWDDCTSAQLKWMSENGTASQKSIARFHLRLRKYLREHYTFTSGKTTGLQSKLD